MLYWKWIRPGSRLWNAIRSNLIGDIRHAILINSHESLRRVYSQATTMAIGKEIESYRLLKKWINLIYAALFV